MTQTEALQMALEWIEKQPEETPHSKYDVDTRYVVIREIEAALAQPEQEPVAWEQFYPDIGKLQLTHPPQGIYYTPPQRKPLSDEQLKEIWLKGKDHGDDWLDVQGIARAIEAAHGIKDKNT